jgi:SAM-dependent methyltransferase
MKCGFCKKKLFVILDLGKSPLANSFVLKNELKKRESYHSLQLSYCKACYLLQIYKKIDPRKIFNDDYVYFSSTSKYWINHAKQFCKKIIKKINLKKNSNIVEIGSNDGYLLKNFNKNNYNILGIEPAINAAKICEKKYNISVIKDFFNSKLVKKKKLISSVDLLIANNVFAHNPDINDFVKSIKKVLKPKGVATIEFPHFYNLYKNLQFDTIYHEHYYYFTLKALKNIFNKHGLKIWDVEEINTHGGSLRIYVDHINSNRIIKNTVHKVLNKETKLKLFNLKTFDNMQKKIKTIKGNVLVFLEQKFKEGKKIAFYGAAAKGNTFLNYLKINNKKISHIFDLANTKIDKYLPGSKIRVHYPKKKILYKFDVIIILAWNLEKEITKQLSKFIKRNCEIFVCIPKIKKTN